MIDRAETPGELLDETAQATTIIRRSRHLVALSGAPMSVESGIPPFRGPGGVWTQKWTAGEFVLQRVYP